MIAEILKNETLHRFMERQWPNRIKFDRDESGSVVFLSNIIETKHS